MQFQVLLLEKLDSQKRNQVTLYFGHLILQLVTNLYGIFNIRKST